MKLELFKPNSKNSGSAVFMSTSQYAKDNQTVFNAYIRFMKQTGWDDKTKRGSFKNADSINLKFNAVELATLLSGVRKNKPVSLIHRNQEGETTTIKLTPYKNKAGVELMYLGAMKGEEKYSIGLTPLTEKTLDELALFEEFLVEAIRQSFVDLNPYKPEGKKGDSGQGSTQDEQETEPESSGSDGDDEPW